MSTPTYTQAVQATAQRIFERVQGWNTATIGWQDNIPGDYERAREAHDLKCMDLIAQDIAEFASQAPVASPAKSVYLVATGVHHEGEETYTRHDACPPMCDAEKLYTIPAGADAGTAEPPIHIWKDGYDVGRKGGLNAPTMNENTANLVLRFSDALREKLAAAEQKYGYSDGWMSPDWMDECRAELVEHVAKGDPRDVAAYCAFLWHHGESTTPVPGGAGGDVGAKAPCRPLETAPRDGTIIRLLVDFEDHRLEDSEHPQWTIGGNSFDNTGVDEWQFAGWSWEQDCFCEGTGKVIGWEPFATPAASVPAGGEVDMRAICEALGFDPENHHNAARCPYCTPPKQDAAPVAVEAPEKREVWNLLHEWRETQDTERADWIEHRVDELMRLAATLPVVQPTPALDGGDARPLKDLPKSELQLELHLRSGPVYQCQSPSCRSYEDRVGKWDTCPSCGLKGFLSGSFVLNKGSAEYKNWEARVFKQHRAAIPVSASPATAATPHGVRCHNDACAGGQLQCPTPEACGVVAPHHPV